MITCLYKSSMSEIVEAFYSRDLTIIGSIDDVPTDTKVLILPPEEVSFQVDNNLPKFQDLASRYRILLLKDSDVYNATNNINRWCPDLQIPTIYGVNDGTVETKIPWFDTFDLGLSVFIEVVQPRVVNRNPSSDYLLMMGRKTPHRDMLWERLAPASNDPFKIYHAYDVPPEFEFNWNRIYPEQYGAVNFEVVAETLADSNSFMTEKTFRPLGCGLPFITLSNKNFTRDMKRVGFEPYFEINGDTIEDRADKIAEIVKDIGDGADFFAETESVRTYNFEHFCYLRGKYPAIRDVTIHRAIDTLLNM